MSNPVPAADVKIGDTVTVQFRDETGSAKPADLVTVKGRVRLGPEGDLMVGAYIVAHANGNEGPETLCVIERIVAEPPLGTVLKDPDGDYWARTPDGWALITERTSYVPWLKIASDYGDALETVTA